MKNSIYNQIKTLHKSLISAIRQTKTDLTEAQQSGYSTWQLHSKLSDLRIEFRHRHVAYSLVRGRSMEQIESKVYPGNEPDESKIQTYKAEYQRLLASLRESIITNE